MLIVAIVQEPGKPLFVSMLLYLNEDWPRDKDAETLFLDTPTDTGIIIRPKVCQIIIEVASTRHAA